MYFVRFTYELEFWLTINNEGMLLRKKAYQYWPETVMEETKNSSLITIKIPSINQLDLDFCSKIMKACFPPIKP